jgi:hypothetical protein
MAEIGAGWRARPSACGVPRAAWRAARCQGRVTPGLALSARTHFIQRLSVFMRLLLCLVRVRRFQRLHNLLRRGLLLPLAGTIWPGFAAGLWLRDVFDPWTILRMARARNGGNIMK